MGTDVSFTIHPMMPEDKKPYSNHNCLNCGYIINKKECTYFIYYHRKEAREIPKHILPIGCKFWAKRKYVEVIAKIINLFEGELL